MFKKNRLKVVISSVVVLLPMLFGTVMWSRLPDTMTTHWGADGVADGFGGKVFTVFGIPLILLATHFICLALTLLDKKQAVQNSKPLNIVFWLVPVISVLANGAMYGYALGKEFNLSSLVPALFGLTLILMGNYFPKIKPNKTLGIRVWWALNNEENWNRTHRLGGKVWVIGGVIALLSVFLPSKATSAVFMGVLAAVAVIPIAYSYCLYRKHVKEGVVYGDAPANGNGKLASRISSLFGLVIVIAVAALMFTGEVKISLNEDTLNINATYWANAEIPYSEIDSAEYRDSFNMGVRTNGVGSARLSLGNFNNEELGPYTLYSYKDAAGFVLLTSGGDTLVIGTRDAAEAKVIYDTVSAKIGG